MTKLDQTPHIWLSHLAVSFKDSNFFLSLISHRFRLNWILRKMFPLFEITFGITEHLERKRSADMYWSLELSLLGTPPQTLTLNSRCLMGRLTRKSFNFRFCLKKPFIFTWREEQLFDLSCRSAMFQYPCKYCITFPTAVLSLMASPAPELSHVDSWLPSSVLINWKSEKPQREIKWSRG